MLRIWMREKEPVFKQEFIKKIAEETKKTLSSVRGRLNEDLIKTKLMWAVTPVNKLLLQYDANTRQGVMIGRVFQRDYEKLKDKMVYITRKPAKLGKEVEVLEE